MFLFVRIRLNKKQEICTRNKKPVSVTRCNYQTCICFYAIVYIQICVHYTKCQIVVVFFIKAIDSLFSILIALFLKNLFLIQITRLSIKKIRRKTNRRMIWGVQHGSERKFTRTVQTQWSNFSSGGASFFFVKTVLKGQFIQKRRKTIRLLGELKTPKRHFEINWHLARTLYFPTWAFKNYVDKMR